MTRDVFLDLSCTPKESFKRGFLKGLGGPYLLFGTFEVDASAQCKYQELPARSRASMSDNWKRVGNDFRAAVANRGE